MNGMSVLLDSLLHDVKESRINIKRLKNQVENFEDQINDTDSELMDVELKIIDLQEHAEALDDIGSESFKEEKPKIGTSKWAENLCMPWGQG